MLGLGVLSLRLVCFFFNDTATTEIYTLSLHDALPIARLFDSSRWIGRPVLRSAVDHADRKSTRLNSSHVENSYAVFCLKKKKGNHASISLENQCVRQDLILKNR